MSIKIIKNFWNKERHRIHIENNKFSITTIDVIPVPDLIEYKPQQESSGFGQFFHAFSLVWRDCFFIFLFRLFYPL